MGRLILIGDAGAPAPDREPVLVALAAAAAEIGPRTTVVVLGDNIYPAGLPAEDDPSRAESERRLREQVAAATSGGARAIFVAGNHDWAHAGQDGWEAVKRQDALLQNLTGSAVGLTPNGGCPGPVVVDVAGDLRLIALDTQWWLHPGPRPDSTTANCPVPAVEQEILHALDTALAGAGSRTSLLVTHHPLRSEGLHGGHFGFQDHVFPLRRIHPALVIPLPIVGSIFPLIRSRGISRQDLNNRYYREMRQGIEEVLARHGNVLTAGGHDHNLQILSDSALGTVLVSGAGIFGHTRPVRASKRVRFATARAGFLVLDRLADGRLRLGVRIVDAEGRATEVHSEWVGPPVEDPA